MITDQLAVDNGLWTFPKSGKSLRTVYVPYFDSVDKSGRKGTHWTLKFNRIDKLEINLETVCTILLYGHTGSLSCAFIKACNKHNVQIVLSSRNERHPSLIYAQKPHSHTETAVAQILVRNNVRKCCYIAKALVKRRIASWNIVINNSVRIEINQAKSISRIREFEAIATKQYWAHFYKKFDLKNVSRRDKHPINEALDMGSFFLFGIISRWVVANRLLPHFGFLHTRGTYPALIYDLMEPYRYIIEHAVTLAARDGLENLSTRANTILRSSLEELVYVKEIRGTAKRKSLLQGVVVALRAYLEGDMRHFVPPTEGQPSGGRPIKITYSILGAKQ